MIVETERMELQPLTLAQTKRLRYDVGALEKEFNFSYQAAALEGFMLTYLEMQIESITANEADCFYHSLWMMIRKSDRVVVGTAAFKGTPNEKGEIEIGYGLGEKFEHQGYMTEAVAAMCKWGMQQKNVSSIIAETEVEGYPSQRILERNGFVRYQFGETSWWRFQK